MNCQKEFLPQHQQDQLRSLINTPEFLLFAAAIKAELALAQSKLVDVAIWRTENDRAEAETRKCILNAQTLQNTVDTIAQCYNEKYQFISVTLTP